MSKERQITITGDASNNIIISGNSNVVLFSNSTAPLAEKAASSANPYIGIESFTEKEADRFFGRDALIKKIFCAFSDLFEGEAGDHAPARILSILGPSGSGKSSVVRAGFVAELARCSLPGLKRVQTAIITPGARPIEQLAGILARIETKESMHFCKVDEFELRLRKKTHQDQYDGLRFIVDHLPEINRRPLILIIDQFEELFDQCKDEEEQTILIHNLVCAAADPNRHASVVLVMRSDFLDAVGPYQELSSLMAEQVIIVPSMNKQELESAISMPPANAGHPIDSATIERLIAQCADRRGVLPLLQISLEQIWEGMLKGRLPKDTLSVLGGIGGSLGTIAQRIFDDLRPADQRIAKRAFIAMVQSGENRQWTRRRVAVSDLIDADPAKEQLVSVLRKFAQPTRRLLTLSGEPNGEIFVEVVHEALFENWALLGQWLDEFQPMISLHRRLNESAEHWHDKGRPSGLLWRSPALEDLNRLSTHPFIKLTATEHAFFEAGKSGQKRRHRTRQLFFGISIAAAIFMAFLAVFSFNKKKEAEQKTLEASQQSQLAMARQLTAQSSQIFSTNNPGPKMLEKGALLGIESLKRTQTIEGYQVWEQAVIQFPQWQKQYEFEKNLGSLKLSPDGTRLVTIVKEGSPRTSGSARMWHVHNHASHLEVDHKGGITDMAFSPDSQFFATASWDRTITLSNTQTGEVVDTIAHDEPVWKVAFSPDGRRLAVACRDGTVKIYAVSDMKELLRIRHEGGATDVLFTPDNDFIISAGKDQSVIFWNSQTGKRIKQLPHDAALVRILISPDGKKLVSKCEDDKAPRVWDIQSQKLLYRLRHDKEVYDMAFSGDGSIIVTTGADRTVRVWDASNGNEKKSLLHDKPSYARISLSPNAEKIVIVAGDPMRAMVWHPASQNPPMTLDHPRVRCAAFSPDGLQLATAGEDHLIRIWDTATGDELARLPHENEIYQLKFSPDGVWLVSAIDNNPLDYSYSWSEAIALDLDSGQENLRFGGHPAHFSSIHFSPDGEYIATSSWDHTVRIWDADKSREHQILTHTGAVLDAAFSLDGKTIITKVAANENKYGRHCLSCQIWDFDSGQVRAGFPQSGGISLSRRLGNDRQLWTAGADATIRLWDLKEGHELHRLNIPSSEIVKVFHPQGDCIATIDPSMQNRVVIRKLPSGKQAAVLYHEDDIGRVDFSPDGKRFVTESISRDLLTVWDLKTYSVLSRIRNPKDVYKVLSFVSWGFSPDGLLLATTGNYGKVRIWEAASGQLISELLHNGDDEKPNLIACRFSGNNKHIITQSGNSIIIWNPISGQKINTVNAVPDRLNISFSPNGRMFRTYDKDGIRIWDTDTCTSMFHFNYEGNWLDRFSFFSSDSRLFYLSIGCKLHIWNLENGKPHEPVLLTSEPRVIFLLPELDLLLTINSAGRAQGRYLSTGKKKYSFGHAGTAKEAHLHSRSNIAVTVSGSMAETYELSSGAKLATFPHNRDITAQISPQGLFLITSETYGDDDGQVKVWNAKSGKLLATLFDESHLLDKFAVNSKDKQLAVAASDQAVHLWDLDTFDRLFRIQIGSSVDRLRFSPDDALLAIATSDDHLQIWDLKNQSKITQIPHTNDLDDFIFTHDSNKIITANDKGIVRMWEIKKPGVPELMMEHEKNVRTMVITPNSRLLATHMNYVDIDHVPVWDLTTGKERYRIHHVKGGTGTIQSEEESSAKNTKNSTSNKSIDDIAMSPDGSVLATAGADGTIKLWKSIDGHKITQWNCENQYPDISFSPDGKLLAVHTTLQEKEDGYQRYRDLIAVWSVDGNFQKLSEIEGYFSEVHFSNNSNKIVTAEGEREMRMVQSSPERNVDEYLRQISDPLAFWGVRIWEASTGKEVLRLPHKEPVHSVALNQKGDAFGVHFRGQGVIRFFQVATGKQIVELPENEANSGHKILFSPDDKYVAIGSYHKITVWDTATWQRKAQLSHADGISDLKFSPNGWHLAWENEGKNLDLVLDCRPQTGCNQFIWHIWQIPFLS